MPGHPYEQGFDLRLIPEKLAEPLRWKKPLMIFVNSMSDLFHKDVPDDYVEAVCRVMERANWHTYQVLTKRSMQKEWVISLRDQCARAGVPFFFKQWGTVRKSKAGRDLDGRTYDEMPDRLELPVLETRERLAAIGEFQGWHRLPADAGVSRPASAANGVG